MKRYEQIEEYLLFNGYKKLKITYSENYKIGYYVFEKRINLNTTIFIRIKNPRIIYFKLHLSGRVLYSDNIKIGKNDSILNRIKDLEFILNFFNFK